MTQGKRGGKGQKRRKEREGRTEEEEEKGLREEGEEKLCSSLQMASLLAPSMLSQPTYN